MIKLSITGWFLLFCLLVIMAISSDIKARPVYLEQTGVITGIEIE